LPVIFQDNAKRATFSDRKLAIFSNKNREFAHILRDVIRLGHVEIPCLLDRR
jgi:hypothetical protein